MPADRYLDPYRESQREHGPAFEVTCWASPRSQRLRFEVFAQMCFLGGKRVLDAGCSRGDLAAFLAERDIPYAHYLGLDALEEVIAYARGRGLPRAEFVCGDFLARPELLRRGDPQVICISGSLNTMSDQQAMGVLCGAWAAAGQTLLFNFLSDRAGPLAGPQLPPVRRLSVIEMLDWALAQTTQVALRHDYFPHGHDATILMSKGRVE